MFFSLRFGPNKARVPHIRARSLRAYVGREEAAVGENLPLLFFRAARSVSREADYCAIVASEMLVMVNGARGTKGMFGVRTYVTFTCTGLPTASVPLE